MKLRGHRINTFLIIPVLRIYYFLHTYNRSLHIHINDFLNRDNVFKTNLIFISIIIWEKLITCKIKNTLTWFFRQILYCLKDTRLDISVKKRF